MTINEYLQGANNRLPEEARRILLALAEGPHSNKEELSLASKVKRSPLDKALLQLHTLGLVATKVEGKSVICQITDLGHHFIGLVWGRETA